jgi:hypothetical protein
MRGIHYKGMGCALSIKNTVVIIIIIIIINKPLQGRKQSTEHWNIPHTNNGSKKFSIFKFTSHIAPPIHTFGKYQPVK